MMTINCHRHNKSDESIKHLDEEFKLFREPMYKYSKEVKNRFFERPWFSFLFVWFARDKNSIEFAEGKFKKNKDKNLTERMKKEMVLLGDEAMGILEK